MIPNCSKNLHPFLSWEICNHQDYSRDTINPHSQQLRLFPQSPGSPVRWMTSSQLCYSWRHHGEHSTLAGLVQLFLLNLQTRAKRELGGNGPGTERSQAALEQVSWQAQAIRKPKVQRSKPQEPCRGSCSAERIQKFAVDWRPETRNHKVPERDGRGRCPRTFEIPWLHLLPLWYREFPCIMPIKL